MALSLLEKVILFNALETKRLSMSINFDGINKDVVARSDSFFSEFLPGGKYGSGRGGRYYSVKDPITNEKHESLVIWTDGNFKNLASGQTGGDFIALYAYLYPTVADMGESANFLAG